MSEKKIKLTVITLKIPITRLSDNKDSKENKEIIEGIDYASYETKSSEDIEMKSWLDLPNQASKVKQYNQRQITYAQNDSTRDYILKKIIKK